jgi:hypothetical protein
MSPKDKLPPSNVLVWCIRTHGEIRLAYRGDEPLATDDDVSRNCHWYDLGGGRHWQDGTVNVWFPIAYPQEMFKWLKTTKDPEGSAVVLSSRDEKQSTSRQFNSIMDFDELQSKLDKLQIRPHPERKVSNND